MAERRIFYYAFLTNNGEPSRQSWRARAFRTLRWLKANRERGYKGFANCNSLPEHFYWHDPCEFFYTSRGLEVKWSR